MSVTENFSVTQGFVFLEFNSKIKLGDQLKKLQNNLKYWGIYNRFQSLYDDIFNTDMFLEK